MNVEYCLKCGIRELHPLPRKFLDRLLCLQPWECARCNDRLRRFRLSWVTVLTVITIAAVSVSLFIWFNPHPFSREPAPANEAEALARARAAMGGQLSTFEQMMMKKPKATLDNATILKLWRANVGTNVILQMIRTSNPDYDLSANAVIELRQAQVDQAIILAMIDTSYQAR